MFENAQTAGIANLLRIWKMNRPGCRTRLESDVSTNTAWISSMPVFRHYPRNLIGKSTFLLRMHIGVRIASWMPFIAHLCRQTSNLEKANGYMRVRFLRWVPITNTIH